MIICFYASHEFIHLRKWRRPGRDHNNVYDKKKKIFLIIFKNKNSLIFLIKFVL